MQTLLFIENYEIELDKSVLFLLNKQFEELSNPTVIINTWSKTVSIPFTANNNKIFGYIYKPERLIVSTNNPDSYKSMGMYFDPTKKLDFRLVYNTMTLMAGYAKMNEIKQVGGKGTYEITLYGLLGKIFQEMQKITFDTTTDLSTYLIDGSKYVNETMNKDLIYNCWNSTGQQHIQLYPKYLNVSGGDVISHPAYKVTDIIGFTPNNSFVEGFDHTTFLTSSTTATLFTTYFDETLNFEASTGMSADTVVPNGFLPREYGDFRSYLLMPFIYFNKLFQIFLKKAELITGYKFELSSDWFNEANTYWTDIVYILKSFNPKNGSLYNNNYKAISGSLATNRTYNITSPQQYSPTIYQDYWVDCGYLNLNPTTLGYEGLTGGNTINIPKNGIIKFKEFPVILSFTNNWTPSGGDVARYFRTNAGHFATYEISLFDENDNLIPNSTRTYGLTFTGNEIPPAQLNLVDEFIYTPANVYCEPGDTYTYNVILPYNKIFTYNDSSSYRIKIRLKYTTSTSNTGIPFAYLSDSEPHQSPNRWKAAYPTPVKMGVDIAGTITTEITTGLIRTNVDFTLNDLWNNEFNLFELILNYCKMYRILINVDDFNKKIIFVPFSTFFGSYTIEDWTDKVDKSKDFIITPVTFESKYVMFNYKDGTSKLSKDYKDKYGVNYGEYKLTTDYNFNIEKTELFKNIKSPIVSTDNLLSYINVARKNIKYSFPSEIYIDNKDKDKKFIDIFGTMFFFDKMAPFNRESILALPGPFISDDSQYQKDYSMFFYIIGNNYLIMTYTDYYTMLNIVKGNNLCVFNIPKENYTYINNYSNKYSIYNNFWERYLNERYSILNKKVSCYIQIKPSDWINFQFNKFIKIDNLLYIINKIYDYDITNSGTTKVDLITVNDITAYTENTYLINNDYITLNWSGTIYINGNISQNPTTIGTFSSLTGVTFTNGQKEITINGVKFTIVGNTIYELAVSEYIDEADINFNVTLLSSYASTTFAVQRYSVYPYPQLSASKLAVSFNDTLELYFDYTPTDEVAPTVTYTRTPSSSGNPTITIGTPVASEIMYQEGNNEYFLTRWTIPVVCTANSSSPTETINFKVTDGVGGWYKNININISALIYTLNSDGTSRQDEDSVEYHGISSTRGYLIYSTHPYEATTIPQGVRFYGGSTGDAGTSSITIDWGSGEPNTSKTVVFTNTGGATCSFVCHYVTQ